MSEEVELSEEVSTVGVASRTFSLYIENIENESPVSPVTLFAPPPSPTSPPLSQENYGIRIIR